MQEGERTGVSHFPEEEEGGPLDLPWGGGTLDLRGCFISEVLAVEKKRNSNCTLEKVKSSHFPGLKDSRAVLKKNFF